MNQWSETGLNSNRYKKATSEQLKVLHSGMIEINNWRQPPLLAAANSISSSCSSSISSMDSLAILRAVAFSTAAFRLSSSFSRRSSSFCLFFSAFQTKKPEKLVKKREKKRCYLTNQIKQKKLTSENAISSSNTYLRFFLQILLLSLWFSPLLT